MRKRKKETPEQRAARLERHAQMEARAQKLREFATRRPGARERLEGKS